MNRKKRWYSVPEAIPQKKEYRTGKKRNGEILGVSTLVLFAYIYTSAYFIRDIIKVVNTHLFYLHGASYYSMIAAALLITYGLGKYIMGGLVDRINSAYSFSICLGTSIFLNCLFFLIGPYMMMNNPDFIPGIPISDPKYISPYILNPMGLSLEVILLALMGFFQGGCAPTISKLMMKGGERRRRGLFVAIFNTAHNGGAGTVGGLTLVSIYLFTGVGHGVTEYKYVIWDNPGIFLFLPTVLGIAGVIFSIVFVKDSPQSVGYGYIGIDEEQDKLIHSAEAVPTGRDHKRIGTSKYILLACLIGGAGYVLRFVPTIGLFKYLQSNEIGGKGNAGTDNQKNLALSLFEGGAIPGTIIFGYLADRFIRYRGLLPMICLIGMIPFMFIYSTTRIDWLIMLGLFMLGFLIYTPLNMTNNLMVMDVVEAKYIGMATGFIGFASYAITAVVTLLIGLLGKNVDVKTFRIMFIILGGFLILAIVLSGFVYKRGRYNVERLGIEKKEQNK